MRHINDISGAETEETVPVQGVLLEGGLKTDFLEVVLSSDFLGISAPSTF